MTISIISTAKKNEGTFNVLKFTVVMKEIYT